MKRGTSAVILLMISVITGTGLLLSGCKKESPYVQQYHDGNPITWEIKTHAMQTRILIDGFPTGIDFFQDGVYPNFDTTKLEGKPCHGLAYDAYILIDASVPGTQGEWVFCQSGYVSDQNVIEHLIP